VLFAVLMFALGDTLVAWVALRPAHIKLALLRRP